MVTGTVPAGARWPAAADGDRAVATLEACRIAAPNYLPNVVLLARLLVHRANGAPAAPAGVGFARRAVAVLDDGVARVPLGPLARAARALRDMIDAQLD